MDQAVGAQALGVAMLVVVLDVDPEDLLQVTTADDQQPVEALGTDGTNPTLREGVGVRRLDRRDHHLGTLGAEHLVEPVTELGVAVAEHNAQPQSIRCRQEQVAGLLGDPGTIGVGRHAGQLDPASGQFDENSTYSRRSQMVSTVNKSQARMPAACWRRNGCQVVVVGRGAGSSP
jgi:hypothetical protein